MSNHYLQCLLFLFSACYIASANSAVNDHLHSHDTPEQVAHVHGTVDLTIAQEGNLVEIAIESPAINIVGFEHQARTNEQKQAVAQAKTALETPTQLFSFIGSDCQATTIKTNLSSLLDTGEIKNTSHREINGHYTYVCNVGSKLEVIAVKLMAQFSGIEKITVMWITDNQQGAVDLTPNANQIKLR